MEGVSNLVDMVVRLQGESSDGEVGWDVVESVVAECGWSAVM